MKKILTGLVMAALVMVPMIGRTAEVSSTPSERAQRAVADAEAAYQKGLATQAAIQKDADQAAASLVKAEADLKQAETSGDKEKIKLAHAALAKARQAVSDANQKLKKIAGLVEKLKVNLDKVKTDAEHVAKAKTPAEANEAAKKAERDAARSVGVLNAVNSVMTGSSGHHLELVGVTIPSTTTSTTQPKKSMTSPTTPPPPTVRIPTTTPTTTRPTPTPVGKQV